MSAVEPLLRRDDACDGCGAPALVVVTSAAGPLAFCGHHYAKHESALIRVTTVVVDERPLQPV